MPAKKQKTKKSQISLDKKTKNVIKNEKNQKVNLEPNFKKLIPGEYDKSSLRDIDSKNLKYIGTLNINSYMSKKSWKDKKDAVENILDDKKCMGLMLTEINVRNKFERKL